MELWNESSTFIYVLEKHDYNKGAGDADTASTNTTTCTEYCVSNVHGTKW